MFFNHDSNVFRTFFASAALAASAFLGSASAAPVPCSDLAISYAQLPSGVEAELEIAIGDTIFVPGLADPIIDIRIRPATMLDPTERYVCDTDYGADLDDAGNASLWFARGGPYYAQVTRQSGLTQGASIGVGCTFRAAGGAGKPDWVEVPKPPHDVALHDPGHTPGMLQPWTDPKPATGLGDAAGQICAASASSGGKVDVVIDAHGNSGGMHLGNDWLDNTTACGFGNDIKGKVKCLTLFSCNVGDNLMLLCTVADKSGATVKAYTGKVVNIGDDVFVEDGESQVTKEPKVKIRDAEIMEVVEVLEGDDIDEIEAPEVPGVPGGFAPPPVLLPIDAFATSFYDAILLMLEAWGEGNSGWDLDHNGSVDAADLALLMELAP